jgi:hypothetical protein
MNDQLPPVDPWLRSQLERRSAGRLPAAPAPLSDSADSAPTGRLSPVRVRPSARPGPVFAGFAVLLAVALVAGIGIASRRGTAAPTGGYPADRALTTAELSSIMTGPALALNTALVADVTIRANMDVCPMNRYPTLGTIDGMSGQVCVMGANVSAYLAAPTETGTFAFRYLAPGYLGLVGKLEVASSSRLAFGVTQEWPQGGRTFLVEGWLGAVEQLASCASIPTAGDVLVPDGNDCPYEDWLGEDATAPSIEADYTGSDAARRTYDPLSLRGNARHVQAGGMRVVDGLDAELRDGVSRPAAIHGTFVIRAIVGACPTMPAGWSVGCATWRVLAKVGDVSLPSPTITPVPIPTAATTYPVDRPLTVDELVAAMGTGLAKDRVVAVDNVKLDTGAKCGAVGSYVPVGAIAGTSLCVVAIGGDSPLHQPPALAAPQTYALRVLDDHTLGYLAWIRAWGGVDKALNAANSPAAGDATVVTGWIVTDDQVLSCKAQVVAGDPLDPGTQSCGNFWISTSGIDAATARTRSPVPGGDLQPVRMPNYPAGAGNLVAASGSATYLLVWTCDTSCGATAWARIDPLPSAAASARASAAVASAAAPATPIVPPASGSTSSSGPQPFGLAGPGGRPLTVAEFETAWASDASHLAGRIVLAKGPIPTAFGCGPATPAPTSASPGACQPTRVAPDIAAEAYWAIRVGSDGKLAIVGELATPNSTFVNTLPQLAAAAVAADRLVVVDAWLGTGSECSGSPGPGATRCSFSVLVSDGSTWNYTRAGAAAGSVFVQDDAYSTFAPEMSGSTVRGLFLVRLGGAGSQTILSRLRTLG